MMGTPMNVTLPRTTKSALGTVALGTVVLGCLHSAGCDRSAPRPATSQPSATTTRGSTQPAVRRVISLSPHITEIIFALGQEDRLVGVTTYCTYPPAAAKIPRCGALMDTDLEKILTLRPDLVVIHGKHETVVQLCSENNIRLTRTLARDLASLYETILTVGRELGCVNRAEKLVANMKADIQRVRSAVAGLPGARVFLSMTRQPGRIKSLYTANGQEFISAMLEAAGGENVFGSMAARYPKIGPGEILRRKPEVIIEIQPGRRLSDQQRSRMTSHWAELGSIPAVTAKRVYFITDNFAMIPGPRVPLLAKRFALLLHPELKGKLD